MDVDPASNHYEDINVLGDTDGNVDVFVFLTLKSSKNSYVSVFIIIVNLGIRMVT